MCGSRGGSCEDHEGPDNHNDSDDSDNDKHDAQVQDQVKAYLEQGGYYSASKHLTQMFAKVSTTLTNHLNSVSRVS